MNQEERLRLAIAEAIRVFESVALADQWMAMPSIPLGGRCPLQLIETDEGLGLVLRELTAIEHGLPV